MVFVFFFYEVWPNAAVDLVYPPTRQKHFELFPPAPPIDPNPNFRETQLPRVHAKGLAIALGSEPASPGFYVFVVFVIFVLSRQAWKDGGRTCLGLTGQEQSLACCLTGIQNPLSYRMVFSNSD